MSDDSFLIHLVSNVAPDTFPLNNPSKFSTPLADEIDVSSGNWEVGVRQIMYPTHVATTGEEDKIQIYEYTTDAYKSVLPTPPTKEISDPETTFVFSLNLPDDVEEVTPADLLKAFNKSKWAVEQGIFKLRYNKKHNKFIINNYNDDIMLQMNKAMSNYFGFEENAVYSRGTHWARVYFKEKKKPKELLTMTMIDMSVLEKAKHELKMDYDYYHNQFLFTKRMPYELHETAPEDAITEGYFSLGIEHNLRKLKITPLRPAEAELVPHMKKIHSIRFHKAQAGRKVIGVYNLDNLKTTPQEYSVPRLTAVAGTRSIEITVYYHNFRSLNQPQVIPKPIASFSVSHQKEIEKPLDLLSTLNVNAKKYDYKFTYDENKGRYVLACGKKYAMQLSKTLADILGFDESASNMVHGGVTLESQTFPVLHREITALYVYTNITDVVYIGDVKAPLLLTCPFKRDKKESINKTMQQEFLNPCYTPLNRSKLQQIDLAIYDDAGALIPFLYGKTKVSLHFRKRQ